MHFMDLVSIFSTVYIFDSTPLKDEFLVFGSSWVSQFWYPDSIQADKTFPIGDFQAHIEKLGITVRPLSPGSHIINKIESKHRVIRSIYLPLKESAREQHDTRLALYRSVSISSYFYGNDIILAFNLSKGFTKHLLRSPLEDFILDEVVMSHENLQAKRKPSLIIKSKAVKETPIRIGDFLEVYSKRKQEKRVIWTAPTQFLSVNHSARSVKIPGKNK